MEESLKQSSCVSIQKIIDFKHFDNLIRQGNQNGSFD